MASHCFVDKDQIQSLASVILISLTPHYTPQLLLAPASWTTSNSWIMPYVVPSAQNTGYPHPTLSWMLSYLLASCKLQFFRKALFRRWDKTGVTSLLPHGIPPWSQLSLTLFPLLVLSLSSLLISVRVGTTSVLFSVIILASNTSLHPESRHPTNANEGGERREVKWPTGPELTPLLASTLCRGTLWGHLRPQKLLLFLNSHYVTNLVFISCSYYLSMFVTYVVFSPILTTNSQRTEATSQFLIFLGFSSSGLYIHLTNMYWKPTFSR